MAQMETQTPDQGFSATAAYWGHVIKTTGKSLLKGAVIGGLALAVLATPIAAPLGGLAGILSFVTGGLVSITPGAAVLTAAVTQGLTLGALAGGAIGLAKGFGGADDAVAEKEQEYITKNLRRQQLKANQEMMAMNMERLRASQMGIAMQPQLQQGLPMGQGMGPKQGFGPVA